MTKTEENEVMEKIGDLEKRAIEHRLKSEDMLNSLEEVSPKEIKKHMKILSSMKKEYEELDDMLAVDHFLTHGAGRIHNSPNE